jgi:small subunit ribosomal protein S8
VGYESGTDGIRSTLTVKLKYDQARRRVITGITRVSKPGRRVYADKDSLPKVLGGMGIAIISTSQGLVTGHEARRRGVGGEVLCTVW